MRRSERPRTVGLGHGDPLVARLGTFGGMLGGHLLVLNLLKRRRYETTLLEPEAIEEGYGKDSYGADWHRVARVALDDDPAFHDATAKELWRMAKSIALGLQKRIDESGQRPGADWYPDGWETMYRLVLDGAPKEAEPVQHVEPDKLPSNPRMAVLAAVDFVAVTLRVDEAEVLRRIRRTRATVRADDERAVLALLVKHQEAQRAAGSEG